MPGGAVSAGLVGNAISNGMIAFDQASHGFGAVNVGASAGPFTFTLANSGMQASGPVMTSSSGSTGDFKVVDNCSGKTLGASCTYVVTFAPATVGNKSLTITASALPGGSASFTVSGAGQTAALPLLLWTLDGNGYNTGSAGGYALTVSSQTQYVAGKFGQALQVNSGAWFETVAGMRALLGSSPQYTIGMWVNPQTYPNTANVFLGFQSDTTKPGPWGGFSTWFSSFQSFTICASSLSNKSLPSGGSCSSNINAPAILPNSWHHLLWRYAGKGTGAGQGASLDFYVDDVKVFTVANDAANDPIYNMNITDTLYLMAAAAVTYDDIRIYNAVYSDAQQCTDIIKGTWNGTSCALP
jgi:hypothetical protein